MIWLFKIDEVFWGNKPKVNECYVFLDVDDIEFDISLYDISLYMSLANYFLLSDTNPDEIYRLRSAILANSGGNNPTRLLVSKDSDYYNVVSNYYYYKSKQK